ncbi:MAG: response regulator, partial [Cyanobacteria bacterium J06560_2]
MLSDENESSQERFPLAFPASSYIHGGQENPSYPSEFDRGEFDRVVLEDRSCSNNAKPVGPMQIPDTHQYTILIVDDSETDRFTYERYINQAKLGQCTVKSCETGEEGLAHCHEQLPDLVLLDYMLPDLDGLEFLEMLQECMAAMPPVIMLTGEGNEAIAVKAMKTGALDYIVKGEITSERLSFAIRRVLNQRIFEQLLNRQQRQQRLMAEIALRISRTSEIKDILETAAEGMRQILDCDRTIIYRFSPDMSGTIVAESVLPEWTASFGVTIEDTCLSSGDVTQSYLEGHKTVISDIHDSHLSPCHIQMLDRFQIKANLVVPIVLREPETQKKK